MKVKVDRDNCIGCGMCASICPDVFELDENEGLSQVICDNLENVDASLVEDAVEGCPTGAITKE